MFAIGRESTAAVTGGNNIPRLDLGARCFASGHLGFVCSISSTQRERRERDASNGCTVDDQRFLPEGCWGGSSFFTTALWC